LVFFFFFSFPFERTRSRNCVKHEQRDCVGVSVSNIICGIIHIISDLKSIRNRIDRTSDAPTLRSTLASKDAPDAPCQHTISNGNVVADEFGRVCRWSEMEPDSGCCVPLPSDDPRAIAPCTSCNARSCCAVYENCVGCCVVSGELFSSCLGRCRTHSGSMVGAREFADPLGKHCFGSFAAPAPQFDRFVVESAAPSAAAPRRFALTFVLCVAFALPVLIFR
jgi:hypothetical protein